jgi:phosphatidylglycerol:prolipoprotein diacylglycerol transferase
VVAHVHKLRFFDVTDFGAPMVPLGLLTGRIGNFINGELWGAPTTLPWGMVFPGAGPEPRHPSMLYEAFLEGLLLFLILWWFGSRIRPRMAVSGLFLVGYGAFRTLVEFVRLPDAHIGYLYGTEWITMGMVLSAPMWIAGLVLMALAYRRR